MTTTHQMRMKKWIVLLLSVVLLLPIMPIPGLPEAPQTAEAATGDNQTLMQYFEWYLPTDGNHWNKLAADAPNLANMGITGVWIPPAYKGGAGTYDVGYGAYDLYDLGEFNQKGTVRTKYGTKAQLQNAVTQLHSNNVEVYLDVVINHKGGADANETVNAIEIDWNDRNREISAAYPISAWTKFTFPGRGNTHSAFKWNASHFNGVDWNDTLKVNRLYKFQGKNWDWEVDTEKMNYDYLMFADVDYDNAEAAKEMENWGVWVANELNLDGFRLDAVKHIKFDFMKNWLNNVRARTGKNLFTVGEYWSGSTGALNNYLNKVGYNMNLFDVDMHYRFYSAGVNNGNYDLRNLYGGTLTNTSMFNSVTFVDNHDSQPGQGLSSWVEPWFKPQSYAFIMTRREGIPTLFYGDYYGIPNNNIAPMKTQLDPILQARKTYAYGNQHDYLDHWDVVGWTREGESARPNSGLATIISDGAAGNKWMYVGKQHAGEVWKDMTGNRSDTVSINADGFGNFQVNSRSVSIWVKGEAVVNDTTPPSIPTGLTADTKTDTTIQLKWAPSTDQSGVAGYDVYRNGSKVGYTTTSSYNDYSLSPSTAYSYTVKAIDLKNNVSAESDALSALTNALNGKLITIYYKKGFTAPHVHYRHAGGTWTVAPGLALRESEITGYSKFIVSTGTSPYIETAFNDGGSVWDNNNSKNYLIYPGTWTYTPGANQLNGTIKTGDPNAAADTTSPTVPGGLTVVSKTDKTVNITWTGSTDAVGVAGYEVLRNGTAVGTTSTTAYSDSGLTPGTTYSYTVKAFDGSGNYSVASPALSVTTGTVAVNNSATIYYKRGFSNPYILHRPVGGAWIPAPVLMKSSEISGYNKITVSLGEATTLEAAFFNGSSTWDNNNGSNYIFEAGTRTYTPGALSSPGTIISGVPSDVSNPTRPSNVKATAVTFSTISLGWSKSSDNKAVVAYDIFRDGKKIGSAASNSFVDSKLTSGTKYAYRVAARDAAGNVSTASSTLYANTTTVDIQPPTAPSNVEATAITTDAISISWLPSSDNDYVKGYDVYRDDIKIGFTEVPNYTDSGLQPATSYAYKIVASDAYPNFSAPSAPLVVTTVSSGATDTIAPSIPSGLTVTDMAADGFAISWTASTDNDSGVKEYQIYDGETLVGTVNENNFSFTGLVEFSEHSLTVKAVDFAGNVSIASESLLVRTKTNFAGISLTNNTITENNENHTVVGSLTGIGIAPGQSVTYQLVSGLDSDDNANFNLLGSQLRASSSFDFETKPEYRIRVRGTDAQGASFEQTFVITVNDLDEVAPSAPSGLVSSAVTDTGFQLDWSAASDNVATTGYQIFADGTLMGTSKTTSYTATGLIANTTYQMTVRALDAADNVSLASSLLSIKTNAPAVQNNVTIYYKRGFATPYIHYRPEGGSWTNVPGVALQPSEFAGYSQITINIGSATRLEACFNNGSSIWDSNNTQNYFFQIGNSTYSPSANGGAGSIQAGMPFSDTSAPTAPTNLLASELTHSSVKVNWNAATDNVGVTAYEILLNGTKVAQVGGAILTYSFNALSASTTYGIRVVAVDANGNKSAISTGSELSLTTLQAPLPNKVTIYYKAGYSTPFIHYRPEGGVWSTAPGLAIPVSDIEGYHKIVIEIGQAPSLSAAFNDGALKWDNNNGLDYQFPVGVSTYIPANGVMDSIIRNGMPIADAEPPAAPSGLSSSSVSHNSVLLGWNAAIDNVAVAYYEIYKDGTKMAQVAGSVLAHTVTDLTPLTLYSFVVVAVDDAGNKSVVSTSVDVKTNAIPPSNKVTIYYKKGFATPYIHYLPEGGNWTSAPGVAIPASEFDGYHKIIIDIGQGSKLTAVFNNGSTIWDNNNSLNYSFEPGVYRFIPGANGTSGTISEGPPTISKATIYYKKGFATPYIHYQPEGGNWTVAPGVMIPESEIAGYHKIELEWVDATKLRAVFNNGGTVWDNNNSLHYVFNAGVSTFVAGENGSPGLIVEGPPVLPDTQAPSAPGDVYSTAVSANGLTLHWTVSSDNVSVTEYEVYQDGVLIGKTSGLSFNVASLVSATSYSFAVQASDAAGNKSLLSGAHSATTLDNVPPTTPANLAVSDVTTSGFRVNWTASTDNVGVALYQVFRSGELVATTTDTFYVFSGLTDGTSYDVTVKAVDAAGNFSDVSAPVNATTEAIDKQAPTAPGNVNSTGVSANGLVLNWTLSSDNVGVTEYEVFRNGTSIGKTTGTTFNVTALTSGISYSFTVQAFDAAGNKSLLSSAHSVMTIDNVLPTVPANVLSSNVTTTGFRISWSASTDNVGVVAYNVYRNGAYVTSVTGTNYTFSGLTAGTTYSVTVLAYDAAKNRSVLTLPVSVTTLSSGLDTLAPSVPTGLVSSNVTTSGFRVSWNAATDNVGVAAYNVYRNGVYITSVTGTNYTFSGLTAGTTHSITVLAYDAAKNRSALTAPLSVTTLSSGIDTTAPSVPSGLVSSNVTTSGFRVSWSASTDNVGVSGYNVYRNGSYVASVTGTNYTFSGLAAGTTHAVTVLAYDAAKNRSALSAALSVKTGSLGPDTTAPSTPQGLVSSNVTTSGFRVSWSASTDNVGVSGYNVYRNGTYVATVTGTFYTFSGLLANTTYNVTVLAIDAAKNRSALSAPLSVKTQS